jgi:very-short-patch-repair endonuclease
MTKQARSMRNVPSAAEHKLWQFLRNRQVSGLKFVRQEPAGPFIADFVCRSCRLVIEVDGPTHDEPGAAEYDARRSAFLAGQGYRVLRFSNEQVLGDLGPVLEIIVEAANCPHPPHDALHHGSPPSPASR